MAGVDANTVFVSNVALQVPATLVHQVLQEAGEVVSFSLRPDETRAASHKGFGTAEYKDAKTAERARHALNGRMVGGRPMKVTLPGNAGGPDGRTADPGLAPLVGRVTGAMTTYEQWKVVSQLQDLAKSNPVLARQILREVPSLSCATLFCLDSLGMLGGAGGGSAGVGSARASYAPAPTFGTGNSGGGGLLAPPMGAPPPGLAPTPQASAALPFAVRDTAAAPAPAAVDPEVEELKRLMAMTAAQLEALPPAQKAEMVALRQALAMTPAQLAALPPAKAAHIGQLQAKMRAAGAL